MTVAVKLIEMGAQGAVLAGLEDETGPYGRAFESAQIPFQEITPATTHGNLLLAILAQAAGMEERALAGRAGQFLDDLTALAGQV